MGGWEGGNKHNNQWLETKHDIWGNDVQEEMTISQSPLTNSSHYLSGTQRPNCSVMEAAAFYLAADLQNKLGTIQS